MPTETHMTFLNNAQEKCGIKNTTFLSGVQEKCLIKSWQRLCPLKPSKDLLLAFKPLVMNIVKKYVYYGVPREDLIQEGWLGLCIALYKYDLNRDVRFSSYAKWWVHSACQDYIMRNWSIVRVGTTVTHKKLFFQLRYLQRDLQKLDPQCFETTAAGTIAKNLQISVGQVEAMINRLSLKDRYLDQKIYENSAITFCDTLEDERDLIESILLNTEKKNFYKKLYEKLHTYLGQREFDILIQRKIHEPAKTLKEISTNYGITQERVRQIEKEAINKLARVFKANGISNL